MKVKELIEELKKYNKEKPVYLYTDDFDPSLNDFVEVTRVDIEELPEERIVIV